MSIRKQRDVVGFFGLQSFSKSRSYLAACAPQCGRAQFSRFAMTALLSQVCNERPSLLRNSSSIEERLLQTELKRRTALKSVDRKPNYRQFVRIVRSRIFFLCAARAIAASVSSKRRHPTSWSRPRHHSNDIPRPEPSVRGWTSYRGPSPPCAVVLLSLCLHLFIRGPARC